MNEDYISILFDIKDFFLLQVGMDDQDWTPVVMKRRGNPSSSGGGAGGVPRRVPVEQTRAINASQHAAAVERKAEAGDLKRKKVTVASRQDLTTARLKLNLTQVEADAKCNVPKNTLNRIENGSYVPDGATIAKIRRALNVDIRFE